MARKFSHTFSRFQARWNNEKGKLLTEIAVISENHFKENFREEGFINDYLEKWSPRKKADQGRAILVKSGRLKRGIRTIRGTSFNEVKIANDVPYAKYHNEGTDKLPRRKFIANSNSLNRKIKRAITNAIHHTLS
jgi:phage gpG-like protein